MGGIGKRRRIQPLAQRLGMAALCLAAGLCAVRPAAGQSYYAGSNGRKPQSGRYDAARATEYHTEGGGRMDVLQPAATVTRPVKIGDPQEPVPLPPQTEGPQEITLRMPAPATQTNDQVELGRLPLLSGLPPELRDPPPRPEVQREYDRFVEKTIDPEVTLDLVVGRPRILTFRETPTRIYLAQDTIASYDIISDKEIAVVGVSQGRTVLTIWMNDPDHPGQQRVLSYLLRVVQDIGYRLRLESVYQALEKEINRDFPDSFVKLSLIGDQLVVRGEAKDVVEAAQILKIVSEHAPPSRQRPGQSTKPTNLSVSQTAYSPEGVLQTSEELGYTLDRIVAAAGLEEAGNIINLLSIPGEQQVMLRVTVAEVNRTHCARSERVCASKGPAASARTRHFHRA